MARAGLVDFIDKPLRLFAQDVPTRPVRVIVPFAPAGTTDIAARLMGQWLSERLGI